MYISQDDGIQFLSGSGGYIGLSSELSCRKEKGPAVTKKVDRYLRILREEEESIKHEDP